MSCQGRRRRRLLCVRRWRLLYIFGDPRAGAQWAVCNQNGGTGPRLALVGRHRVMEKLRAGVMGRSVARALNGYVSVSVWVSSSSSSGQPWSLARKSQRRRVLPRSWVICSKRFATVS